MMRGSVPPDRRTFLRLSTAFAASLGVGCSHSPGEFRVKKNDEAEQPRSARAKTLLVYFSRAGENYFHGGRKVLTVGNTAVVAEMIRDALGCDVFRIQAADPYPTAYEPTVARNVREQNDNARPAIVDLLPSIEAYTTILIGSPIWNVRVPRIMLAFAEHFDFTGKVVHPFTTFAMSGLGHAVDEYAAACRGATIGEALAIQGEEAETSRNQVVTWLRKIRLA